MLTKIKLPGTDRLDSNQSSEDNRALTVHSSLAANVVKINFGNTWSPYSITILFCPRPTSDSPLLCNPTSQPRPQVGRHQEPDLGPARGQRHHRSHYPRMTLTKSPTLNKYTSVVWAGWLDTSLCIQCCPHHIKSGTLASATGLVSSRCQNLPRDDIRDGLVPELTQGLTCTPWRPARPPQ